MFPSIRGMSSFLLLALAPCAYADTATLSITGRVLPGTCVLTVPSIALPPVKANDLVERNNLLQPATLELTSCVGVTQASLTFDGVAEAFDAELWKNTATTGAAINVSFAVLQGSTGTTYIKKGTTLTVPVAGGTASQQIRVGYYRTGSRGITAGVMAADITVTASYQ